MIYIQIALTYIYFVFLAWLSIATYVNYVLGPFRNTNWKISNSVSWAYTVLWGVALAAPTVYGLVLESIGA